MYIKEIKINGFKSFAENVNLELNRNFTGIVGPNGSGKSNIVDALKWVMGEQSVKTLRGTNGMTDVIFNGSASREGARCAKVAIVLDNSDKSIPLEYEEIEIKRVVYKTGENEYFINNEKVRLKDITDLFVDTFSSKESLSIIPQGKISEIVNGKAEDKRVVIEEAASVVKYKKRKEEALRKLAKTNENLDRVNMIINELSFNIGPLEEQAKKAKTYKEAKDKLENLEVSLLSNDIYNLNEEYTSIKNEKESLENKLASFSADDSKEKATLETMKLNRTKMDDEITILQRNLVSLSEEENELNNKKELLKERNKYDKDSDEVQKQVSIIKENKLIIDNQIKDNENKYNSSLESFNSLQSKLKELNNEYNSLNVKITSINNEINSLNKNKMDLSNRKDILEYNIENNAKMPYSVKSIINNPSLSGIVNTIGNLIEVSSEYSTAIDTALSSSSNFVVTKTDKDAKEAIEYLKRNNKGRVTFFPMNLIKGRSLDNETLSVLKGVKGYIGVASDLVTFDKEYENIITNQLGNIIISTTLDDALSISKKINSKYRVVSLDGEIVHVGGSLTGGSKNTNGSLSDKTELDKINTQINTINSKIEELNSEYNDLSSKLVSTNELIQKTNIELISKNQECENINNTINELKQNLSKAVDELNALDSKNNTDKELDNVLNEYYKKSEEKKQVENDIKVKEENRKKLIEEIELLESSINKNNHKYREIETSINNLSIKEAKLSVNLDTLLNRLSEEYNMTYERARNNYELTMDIEEARNIVVESRKVIKSLGEVNLGSIDEFERVKKRYDFLTTQKEDLVKSEENLLGIINNMDDVMIDKFATTFKKVNQEFSSVFKKLFGGGDAHLELTDPTNLLETGVEIIAYPPGKKPGAISLLSGGEMTLTAISLLFAVMNLKNVPFVILDEVESALDEVNVEKFGKYLSTYKGKTQLLVITHKKKTMEYLDLLYGITMQESGVSKLVSVKLEDADK